tara:strand:+ start:15 stop:599 length:585 start_codon:yes stop_codon:yes gene_type:complete
MTAQSKLNNEAVITPNFRQRLDQLYNNRYFVQEENAKVKKIDPNMFCEITDPDEHYIKMAEQIVYKNINGTCLQENIDLYYKLKKEGKDPMLMRIEYINKVTGNDAFHIFNIIKINGLYYVRDHSNYTNECKELRWWLLDRQGASITKHLYRAKVTENIKGKKHKTLMKFQCYNEEMYKLLNKNLYLINKKRKR